MKIVPTFATQDYEGVWAIRFFGEKYDELEKCLRKWLYDTEFLFNFFDENKQDLNSDYFGNITIQEAIKHTRAEAAVLFRKLGELAVSGADGGLPNLSAMFEPLNNNEYRLKDLQQVKGKSKVEKRWLRIYAIKISTNTFIITGGAIKLVEKMQENASLRQEKQKLEKVNNFLEDNGILDQEDFELNINSYDTQ